ncbi:MAG TPA: SpoIIE family protein phosphatase [Bacillota bacterium]|nr:SpoIIE family protein phosphatase [Bacillota bacterium]
MNNLCTDIAYSSLNKHGETLCGDSINIIRQNGASTVVVLADGLGSGVKASILSTLTSKIISTMVAEGLSIEECVSTIASTLPVCSQRGLAYSTFTIISIINNSQAEIIQYDSPGVILLRDGKSIALPTTQRTLEGKTIYHSKMHIKENDFFVGLSDGAIHAGVGHAFNFGWQREDIIDYLLTCQRPDSTAKSMTTMLIDECNRLYDEKPGDDTTVCCIRIRKRQPVNLMIGPPANRDDLNKMMSLFFSKEGKHIVCGGTTSTLAADHLGKPLEPHLVFPDPEIPPTASLEGVDLVTEGVITMSRVLRYAQEYLERHKDFSDWSLGKDGASKVAQLLFDEATDINFFVGRAINPAHQNPDLPISFNIKMRLIDELAECLRDLNKRIKVSYF